MNKPCISVVIPAHNSSATIGQCLEALHQQTYPPLELIVVDDGSTDDTPIIAKKWAKVIENTRTIGPGGARNSGAAAAKGTILAFTDSDCIPQANWLENIVEGLSHPDVGAVGAGYCSGVDNSFWQVFCHRELAFRRRNQNQSTVTLVSNNMACKESLFREVGGFPERFPVCEDMLLSYKISTKKKLLWIGNNGVQHHFKRSLKDFLRHQYFFGAESTRFFLNHRNLLLENTHQTHSFHLAIIIALTGFFSLLAAAGCTVFQKWLFASLFNMISIFCFASHLMIYIKKRNSCNNIAR